MPKIINFVGASCSGKSTASHKLFSMMKEKGMKVEFAREFVKDYFYGDVLKIPNQMLITGQQIEIQKNYMEDVDYIVAESPICLGYFYAKLFDSNFLAYHILNEFNKFDNYNVFVERKSHTLFDGVGRGTGKTSDSINNLIKETKAIKFDRVYEAFNVDIEQILNDLKYRGGKLC